MKQYNCVYIALLLVLLCSLVNRCNSHSTTIRKVTEEKASRAVDDYYNAGTEDDDSADDDGTSTDDDGAGDDDDGTDDDGTDDTTGDDESLSDDGTNDDDGNANTSATSTTDDATDDINADVMVANLGSIIYLDNLKDDGTILDDEETPAGTIMRLKGVMPTDNPRNFRAKYSPLVDSFCFNEEYPLPTFTPSEQQRLYRDYQEAFDLILVPTTDLSEDGVTFNRIPGMFLRMCFHDNSVDAAQPDFRQYVSSAIDPVTKQWTAESRYMKTSGADASNLICPEERYHPNSNLDQTASRVLRAIQTKLKNKYPHVSYADFLHNGCNAATIYLTHQDPVKSLDVNPFTFGRKDACYVNHETTKKQPLCGPAELLPGQTLTAIEATSWFTSRGMSVCLFMGLMWTHTTVALMGTLCPLTRLTCITSPDDVATYPNPTGLYFQAEDNMDYFNFFLARGTQETLPDLEDGDELGCKWVVDGKEVAWPMTGFDCTLGLSNVKKVGPKSLARVIRNFAHDRNYNRVDILQCALKVLGGDGGTEAGSCDLVIPSECQPNPGHKFGGFYH